ncbi:MAG: lactate utilization protein [Selenomonas sp.]|uniref:lactate utilization protein n=1 Tax=Selenomonas sp. TaxID=2053611 RepID=UPI0025D93568|nr:lactate utilization protein [Selenomonas sp.]MCI6101340.1 lactate utilization protein [Selenomonas sp.]MCI6231542.1 lactate utilization protein [Selenomonas sp.]
MDFSNIAAALRKREYAVSCFSTAKEAAIYLDAAIDGQTVGFGDSMTLLSLGIYDLLARHNDVRDPEHPREGEDFYSTARKALLTDVFLTSVNGLAETGEMVNIDGTGNRVAGSLYGHKKVYFVIGSNKIAPTLEEATWRARNVAAPQNAARHGYQTPCARKQDHCYDCYHPNRICNAQVIYWQKMNHMDMEVVLIDEPLGL